MVIYNKGNKGKSKYNAKKIKVGEITFDSKKEANRFIELKILKEQGKITDLILQPEYVLQEGFDIPERKGYEVKNKRYRAIKYIADFEYYDVEKNKIVIEDVKGYKTEVYKIKKKLFLKSIAPYIIKNKVEFNEI